MNKLVATGMDKRFRVFDMRTQVRWGGVGEASHVELAPAPRLHEPSILASTPRSTSTMASPVSRRRCVDGGELLMGCCDLARR